MRVPAAASVATLGIALSGCMLDPQGTLDPCAPETTRCGEGCLSLRSDPLNCGACGAVCAAPGSCVQGVCVTPDGAPSCSQGLQQCGGICVDLQTDKGHCGACAHACDPASVCQQGACEQELSCGAGETQCGNACVDLQTHPAHCGGCNQPCTLLMMCSEGACKPGCTGGLLACAGKCVDPLTDTQYCGASGDCVGAHGGEVCGQGRACTAGVCDPCVAGEVACDGFCVDLQTDPLHCGSCPSVCDTGHACHAGACEPCAPSELECSGVCVDPQNDPGHCGDCATVCATGHACNAGLCALCLQTETECSGTCVTLASDPNHCGSCSHACTTGHPCEGGVCSPCPAGQTLCSYSCVDPSIDLQNCGGCGQVCTAGPHAAPACSQGACNLVCDFGFKNANGDASDGCEATDMLLWLRADKLTSLAAGDPVAEWADASGNGRTAGQTTEARKPKFVASAINGKPAVSFDGADDFLVTPEFPLLATGASELTIAVVFRATDLGSQRFLMMQPQNNCSNNLELGYRTGQADRANFGLHHGCSHATVTVSNIDTSWRAMIVIVHGTGQPPANVVVLQGGASVGLELDNGGWVGPGGYGTASRKVVIGGRDDVNNGSYNSFHKGELAELIVIRGALGAADLGPLSGWLSSRYGL